MAGKSLHKTGVAVRTIMLAARVRIDDIRVDFRDGENGFRLDFFDDHIVIISESILAISLFLHEAAAHMFSSGKGKIKSIVQAAWNYAIMKRNLTDRAIAGGSNC